MQCSKDTYIKCLDISVLICFNDPKRLWAVNKMSIVQAISSSAIKYTDSTHVTALPAEAPQTDNLPQIHNNGRQ